ncbi:MAG: hypothetical protein HC784_08970 [Hydrococcus sp. CSU_1_8]|nr:hypothetical protein [Hydrococcus sp. CSU_1_8]
MLALLGSIALNPKAVNWIGQNTPFKVGSNQTPQEEDLDRPSVVLSLSTLMPEQREAQLESIASSDTPSLERSRARYFLASDLIKKYEGGPALIQLKGLEEEYPLMAPYILLKRGRAYELTNETIQAQETWQLLLKNYPILPSSPKHCIN